MSAHHDLFGLFVPGDSVWHRSPVGAKMLLVLAVSLVPLVARTLAVSLVLWGIVALLLLATRVPVRTAFPIPRGLVVVLAVLFACQLWWATWVEGAVIVANVVLCLWASRILTLTSTAPALLDAMVAAVRPLRVVGVDPERVGLAAALMLRSVPHLMGSFADVRDAARARGIERNVLAQVTPVVVGAVAYAQATGEALAARGLGEGDDPEDGAERAQPLR
ncbi:energy-coupling factor transporter transmembrane component T family protein [Mariniluteicoccus flavus]